MVFSHLVFSSCPAEYDKNGRWEIHFSAHSGQISVPTLSRVAQLFQRPDNSASGSQGYDGAFFFYDGILNILISLIPEHLHSEPESHHVRAE